MWKVLLISFVLFISFQGKAADTLVFKSHYLPQNDTVLVYQPMMTGDIKQYPIIYLLHGYGGDYTQWNKIVNLQAYAEKYGAIIVCPDGLKDSWYFDSPRHADMKFESFFIKELMPKINKSYYVDSTMSFVSGLSMGGHGAMYLFLRNPGLFYSAASTSGVLDLHASGLKFTSLSNRLGDYKTHKKVFDSYSSINKLDTLAFSTREILIDCGTRDHLYNANVAFYEKCKEKRIQAHFISSPGRHNAEYWRKSIEHHFVFFDRLYYEKLINTPVPK